jgi:hypothetical protein
MREDVRKVFEDEVFPIVEYVPHSHPRRLPLHGRMGAKFGTIQSGRGTTMILNAFAPVRHCSNMSSEEPMPLEETQHFALTVHLAAVQRAINCAHVYG